MSSEVQAKWMNSARAATSALLAERSLSQYSIALTSWLVSASIALMRSASRLGERRRPARSSAARVAGENGFSSSMARSAASACSHSISTRTR